MNRRLIALLLFPALAPVFPASGQAPPAGPLTLRRAAERALARAPEASSARAQAAEADADARAAAATFGPRAFATTTPGYSSGLPVEVAGRVPSVFGVEVHQTLYDPARRAEALAARVRAEAFEAASTRSGASTARALVLSYGRNWSDRRQIENARRDLEAREAVLRRVAALAREGRRTDLDAERAGLEVARAKQALANREAEWDLDRLELAWLTDSPRGEPIQAAEDPLAALAEPPPGDHLAAARSADPELAALDREISALETAARFQKRTWLPTIEAEGRYLRLSNYNNLDQYFVKFKTNDWAVGISVVVPLWTGGRLQHGQTAADARVERIRADRRGRERDLELAVRRAEADLSRARAEFQLSSRALAAAREGLRVAQSLATEGRGDADGVDLSQIAVAKAEDEASEAAQGLLAARARLLELRGELPAALLGVKPSDRKPEGRTAEGTE